MLPYYLPPYHFAHYPEGLKGRYVASPSAAAHLGGRRVFSSRSEYTYKVSVDRKCRRRRRALEVASRAAEREQQGPQVALPSEFDEDEDELRRRHIDHVEDAAWYQWCVWSDMNLAEVRSVTPQFLADIRRARCRSRPARSAVRRCVRTEKESAEVSFMACLVKYVILTIHIGYCAHCPLAVDVHAYR